jgi:integrase-like protein
MSFLAKRELLVQVAARYRDATGHQKSHILDEFVAATGYARKYAIHLLTRPELPPVRPLTRPRPRHYGPEVQAALELAWTAANEVCAKRLVPFLPELVASLERHGHLSLSEEVRAQLLQLSPATADRLLQARRRQGQPRGISTTKPGALLKRHVPVRTFTDWNDARPGFLEADLVAHCGTRAEGSYLYSLVLTDVATGWTECLPLLHRSQAAVLQALDTARCLLPFPLLGLDTDNGSEFLNQEVLAYCERRQITFTRGRAYKKNDQCYVEQKNGSIVRALVGYDRFAGESAYRQLAELYRAVRLYVNGFQPSMKLRTKHREGSKVSRTYHDARTPLQRLVASATLPKETQDRLVALFAALDPVRLLHQLHALQEALWQHAIVPTGTTDDGTSPAPAPVSERRFDVQGCGLPARASRDGDNAEDAATSSRADLTALLAGRGLSKRKYRRSAKQTTRTWRTRADPFASIWEEVRRRLELAPERTAKAIFLELQREYPGRYPDGQLRTLQRRVKEWRARAILQFDQRWLEEELLPTHVLPAALQAQTLEGSLHSASAG